MNKYENFTAKELAAEEVALALDSFSHEQALALGQMALTVIADAAVAMEVRKGNQLVFKASMPGTSQDNDWWLNRKFKAADRFGHSSLWVKKKFQEMGQDFEIDSGLDQDLYAAHGGSSSNYRQGHRGDWHRNLRPSDIRRSSVCCSNNRKFHRN